jgi:hypothetical protein
MRGKWTSPINNIKSVDTMMRGCMGPPSPSLDLILTTNGPGEVSALFGGKVTSVIKMEGEYMITVKFEDYLLIYSGLSKPIVSKGSSINKGQIIGRLKKVRDEEDYSLWLTLVKKDKVININQWFDWQKVHNSSFR